MKPVLVRLSLVVLLDAAPSSADVVPAYMEVDEGDLVVHDAAVR